jgi:hypothetical protein
MAAVAIDPKLVSEMVGMGFARHDSVLALQRHRGNVPAAVEWSVLAMWFVLALALRCMRLCAHFV